MQLHIFSVKFFSLFAENFASQAARSSMAASALTTLAEEIFSLLRYLHESIEWTDMINFHIWRYLKYLENDVLTLEVFCLF